MLRGQKIANRRDERLVLLVHEQVPGLLDGLGLCGFDPARELFRISWLYEPLRFIAAQLASFLFAWKQP